MTPEKLDDLAVLRAANPVDAAEPLDDAERASANALLERIVAAPPERPARRVARYRPRRLMLAGAGALGLAAILAVLVLPGGRGADAVAQAVAALSSREGVFHVVTQTTTSKPGRAGTRTWTETWAAADGSRSRSLIYDVAPSGRRGRLVAERVGDTTVISRSPRDRGPISDDGQLAVRPRAYVLGLLRGGHVTRRTTVTVAGRPASRFEIERRFGRTIIQSPAGRTTAPASTSRYVLVVDARTHLPLSLRTSGVVPTDPGSRGGRVTFPRRTTTARFSRFERLTDADGAAGLRASRRFR